MKKAAIFTVVHNERHMFPIWLRYYQKNFSNKEIYIINDASFDGTESYPDIQYTNFDFKYSGEYSAITNQIMAFQKELLKNYEIVVYTDVDEILSPSPKTGKSLRDYIEIMPEKAIKAMGVEPYQAIKLEGDLDLKSPLMQQRKYGRYTTEYNKTLVTTVPLDYSSGQHNDFGFKLDENFFLIHLHYIDFELFWARKVERLSRPWRSCPHYNQIQKTKEEYMHDWIRMHHPVYLLSKEFSKIVI